MSSPKSAPTPATQTVESQTLEDHSPIKESSPTELIEVDADETGSTYPESLQVSDSSSLRSSILNYKWENGRRYHAYQDGAYWGPNDERQQNAEDLIHELHRILLDGKLCNVPIKSDVQNVLDLGCGTGIWAIEFADEYPSAEVVGVDLSPIQPTFVPPNCLFEVDDINEPWTHAENKFDFIHIRALTGSVPDWVEFQKKCFRHLKSGGWVEHVELSVISRSDDGTIKLDSLMNTWVDVFDKIGTALGKTFFACEKATDAIREAGFINLRERRIKLPIGTWPKDKQLKQWGAWNRQFLLQAMEGFSLRGLTELLGWPFEDAQAFMGRMRSELLNSSVHAYIEVCIVGGQKPEENDQPGILE